MLFQNKYNITKIIFKQKLIDNTKNIRYYLICFFLYYPVV